MSEPYWEETALGRPVRLVALPLGGVSVLPDKPLDEALALMGPDIAGAWRFCRCRFNRDANGSSPRLAVSESWQHSVRFLTILTIFIRFPSIFSTFEKSDGQFFQLLRNPMVNFSTFENPIVDFFNF